MRFRLSCSAAVVALGLLCWAALRMNSASAQESKARVVAKPASSTNSVVQLPPQRDALKQLEDQLSSALKSLTSRGQSAEPPLAPQYTPPVIIVPSQRAREAEERRKNWIFSASDSLDSSTPAEDWANAKDQSSGGTPTKANPLDAFYDNLNRQHSADFMPPSDDSSASSTQNRTLSRSSNQADDNLPKGVKDAAARLRDWLDKRSDGGLFSSSADGASSPSLFGASDTQPTPEQIRAHKAYMSDYQKILNDALVANPNSLTPLDLGSAGAPAPVAQPSTLDTLPDVSTPASQTPTPGTVTRVTDPGVLPDANATVLNQWNPLYARPRLDPVKQEPFSVPVMVVPRRPF